MSFRNGLRQAQQQFARTQIRHNSTAQQQAKEKATAALNQAQAQATAALGKASKQAGELVNKAKGYSSTFSSNFINLHFEFY
jgi:regulator of protease activity HflC (stomatin/prohibitin superfamily)